MASNDLIVIDDDSSDDDENDCEEIRANRRNSSNSDDVLFVGGNPGWKSCQKNDGGLQNTFLIPNQMLADINSLIYDDLRRSGNSVEDLPSLDAVSSDSDTASLSDDDAATAGQTSVSASPALLDLSKKMPLASGDVSNAMPNGNSAASSSPDSFLQTPSSKEKHSAALTSELETLGKQVLERCEIIQQAVTTRNSTSSTSTSNSRKTKKKRKTESQRSESNPNEPCTSRNAVAEGSSRDCLVVSRQEQECIAVLDDGDDGFSSALSSAVREDDDDIQMISQVRPRKKPVPQPVFVLTDDDNDRELSGCASCFSMFSRSSMVACPFGHYSCIKCLEYQIKSLVWQPNKDTLKCFMARCNNEYPMAELRRFLPPLVLDILNGANNPVTNDRQNEAAGTVALPVYWTSMDDEPGDFIHVPLNVQSTEFNEVATRFEATMGAQRPQIVSIKRVQNKYLWECYALKKKKMEKDSGSFVTEERLFHGTSSSYVDVICRQNFDWRLAGTHGTAYGQGSYFARDASYSHGYTDARDNGHAAMLRSSAGRRSHAHSFVNFMPMVAPLPVNLSMFNLGAQSYPTLGTTTMFNPLTVATPNFLSANGGARASGIVLTMFMARVLVGRYCAGSPSFRRPPPINHADALRSRLYDSCVDNVHNPSIYVIFDTAQCYPEYTIEYRVNVG